MHIAKESSSLLLFGIFLVSVRFGRESSLAGTQAAASQSCLHTDRGDTAARLLSYPPDRCTLAGSTLAARFAAARTPLHMGGIAKTLCTHCVRGSDSTERGASVSFSSQKKTNSRGDSPPPPPGRSLTGVPTGSDQTSKLPFCPPAPLPVSLAARRERHVDALPADAQGEKRKREAHRRRGEVAYLGDGLPVAHGRLLDEVAHRDIPISARDDHPGPPEAHGHFHISSAAAAALIPKRKEEPRRNAKNHPPLRDDPKLQLWGLKKITIIGGGICSAWKQSPTSDPSGRAGWRPPVPR